MSMSQPTTKHQMMICVGVDMHKQSDATAEVDMYLSEISREIERLVKFTGIAKLLKKSMLRSSAPVEE